MDFSNMYNRVSLVQIPADQ